MEDDEFMYAQEGDLKELNALREKTHYCLGQYCDRLGEERNATFSKEYVYCLSELIFTMMEGLSVDLERFARHAKRSTIHHDDILLCARKNQDMEQRLNSFIEQLKDKSMPIQNKKKRKLKKNNSVDLIELSD